MARPTNIKDETIVAAARELFLERGIRVTTAEVAGRAGVSEGSIFNRFPTKEHLFRAAMQSQLEAPQWFAQLAARVGKGDPRESMIELASEILGFFRTVAPLMMMLWSNHDVGCPALTVLDASMPSAEGELPAEASREPMPVRAIKLLSAFFAAEIRLGRVRRHDPEILARAFLGGIANYAFIETLNRGGDELSLPAEPYLRGLVHLLWTGIAPAAPLPEVAPARARSPKPAKLKKKPSARAARS